MNKYKQQGQLEQGGVVSVSPNQIRLLRFRIISPRVLSLIESTRELQGRCAREKSRKNNTWESPGASQT